jgi:C4-dicarboxylate-specific signal transduction histidine kinase
MIRSRDKERGFTVKLIPLELSEKEKQTLIVLEEITETERLWEKMAQAEKLASLGLLSAGRAHEINNPLDPAGSIPEPLRPLRPSLRVGVIVYLN